jgi:hypothetical protein
MPAPYPQRVDLAVATPKSKTYGDATASRQSQQAVPMGTVAPPQPMARPASRPQPLIPLDAPTRNPMEPITAGANFGAGPNSTGAGLPVNNVPPSSTMNPKLDLIDQVKYIYSRHPNTALYQLLLELEGSSQ